MREKRSFSQRTRVLPNDEVKKKYFLVYEGKKTEAIYFEAVDVLKEYICAILALWEHGNQKTDTNICYSIILFSYASIERNC